MFSSQRYHGVPSDRTDKTSPEWSNQIEGQENIEGNTKTEAIAHESSSPQKPHWINGVLLCAKATTALLLLNIIFIAVAAGLSNRNSENRAFSSFQVMYEGSCVLSKRWNVALHLIINVLSTGILGASNYCMQSLVAPSREEVDKYHARGRWLDIGCSSVRNLFVIGRSRLALWLVLLVTATPFHLLYNSMVFESVAINELRVVVGPGDLNSSNIASLKTPALDQCFSIKPMFPGGDAAVYRGANVDGDDTSNSYLSHVVADGYPEGELNWQNFASDIARGDYERLNTQQCIDLDSFGKSGGAKVVVMLTNALSVSQGGNTSMLSTSLIGGLTPADTTFGHDVEGSEFAGKTLMINILDSGRAHYYTNDNFTQKACLDTLDDSSCSDAYDVLNWASLDMDQPTIERVNRYIQANTTSDITASGYVTTCDDTSMNESKTYSVDGCLVIKPEDRCQLLYSPPICIIIALATFLKVVAMFLAARIGRHRSPPLLTVGDAVASFMERPDRTTEGMCWLSNADVRRGAWKALDAGREPATLDNDPRLLIITVSYFFYNSVLTSMLATGEYSSYGASPKPLRVTWPIKNSMQQSTYWLSMPYQYGVPLLMIYMVLHWLISQSIFYVRVMAYDWIGRPIYQFSVSSLGYNPLAIFISILVGALMVCLLLGLSSRRFKSEIPLAGACSVAISAACHVPRDEPLDQAARGMVMWGETMASPSWTGDCGGIEDDKGHCSFTSLDTVRPSLSKMYA
ncbi:hypothetical protein N7449_002557 [Penicillium cf. viridicatum]|uniref:DUF6536 domain-containing protein n=1 Tax=Penicillium cf. viridicatum TaxID=2972119 RepID=A0A9W9MVK3_9EURO|nr:hypothetical protein N7449_002557 [Penicillium cf. viridicatum]